MNFCKIWRWILFLSIFFSLSSRAQVLLDKITSQNHDSLNPQVLRLEKKLREYELIANQGGWGSVPVKKDSIRAGKRNKTIMLLRQRLETEGYLPKRLYMRSDSFDTAVTEAVKRFQRNNGLAATGYLSATTMSVLNIPVQKRIEQIKVNLERWKVLPPLGPKYIFVNIPDFKMEVFENHKPTLSMKVVVGKIDRQTPVFNSSLTYIVLNPTWNVPQNILDQDILAKVKKNPNYLAHNHMTVFQTNGENRREISPSSINWKSLSSKHVPYEVIQQPGSENALGVVKFMFPNSFSVYMHDSPAKKLFESEEPLFSSGCVRLSNAMALAEYLLAKEDWDKTKLKEKISEGKTQTVSLKDPLPVYLQYMTAWVDVAGQIQFRKDIYNLDAVKK